jgi:hypothetical protein
MSFASMGLHPDLLRTLTQRGHLQPTPIQAAALPAALAGRDLIGAAVTGSGKTLAYVLPILQHLLHTAPETPRPVHALVLVPARDLALQVSDTFAAYAQALAVRVKVVTVFGGVSVNPQLMALRGGADVVVATPGRLLDLVARRRAHGPEQAHSGLRLDRLDTQVLVEADRPADLGDELWADGRKVGVITCPSYSKLTNRSMGIARLDVGAVRDGGARQLFVDPCGVAHRRDTFDVGVGRTEGGLRQKANRLASGGGLLDHHGRWCGGRGRSGLATTATGGEQSGQHQRACGTPLGQKGHARTPDSKR